MDIYVFINEGTIYTCEQQYCQAVLSEAEWEALDKAQQYAIQDGKVVLASSLEIGSPQTPVPSVYPPLPIETMYIQAGVGDIQRIDALWDLVVKQESTKVDSIISTRKEVDKEWERLQAEYEAAQ